MANEHPAKWLPIWPGSTEHDPGGQQAVGVSQIGSNGHRLYWSGKSWQLLSSQQVAAMLSSTPGADNNLDVIVYGGSSFGVMAAVAAARQNKSVLLLSESSYLGGMLGWGMTWQDLMISLTPGLISGITAKFFESIGVKETAIAKTHQRFHRLGYSGRPSWFIRALNRIIAAEKNIRTLYNVEIVRANKAGAVITSLDITVGGVPHSFSAKQFIDASSSTGDLIAAAGCTYQIGRESSSAYSEPIAGVMAPALWNSLSSLDPYVTAGVPGSGLLPYIDGSTVEDVGTGDGRCMYCNYRIFVTTNAPDRIPFPAPDTAKYNPLNYELLGRAMAADSTKFDTVAEMFNIYPLPTLGSIWFDLNAKGAISTSYPNEAENREYVTATEARRAVIRENAKQWLLGLLYWIRYSGDVRIPAGLVSEFANYGLSKTELEQFGGFSPEFYLREGRRLVGDSVFNYNNLTLGNGFRSQTVAWMFFEMDSHPVRIVNASGVAKMEGNLFTPLTVGALPQIGSPVPFSVMLPKRLECTNLLAPGAPSVSRVVWASLRMLPNLMMMGEAAGIGASLAIDHQIAVQDVNVPELQKVTDPWAVWDGVVVSTDAEYQEGTVTQSPAASWAAVATRFGFIGPSCLSDNNTGKGKTLKFAPNIQETGAYEVLFRYPPDSTGRANNVTVTISHAAGSISLTVNQLYPGGKGGTWESLGVYTFRNGLPSADYALVDTTGTTDYVVASAFKFRRIGGV